MFNSAQHRADGDRRGNLLRPREAAIRLAITGMLAAHLAVLPGVLRAASQKDSSDREAPKTATQQDVDRITAAWPEKPKEAAKKMIDKYGLPNEATDSRLIWLNNAPWKYTILHREEVPHNFPKKHTDFIEQAVDYAVPPELFDDLAVFDGSVTVRRTKGEMSAMCDKEEMNFLALNLAHDIITGKLNVVQARQSYVGGAMEFMKGQKHPFTQKLQFVPPQTGTGYLDQEAMPK